MQISVDADRMIVQQGHNLGERDGCSIEEVADETIPRLRDALAQAAGHGVIISVDHAALTVLAPAQAWSTAEAGRAAQRAQQQADIALLAGSDDPHHQAQARLLASLLHLPPASAQ